MTSDLKLASNRKNAKSSTGPKSDGGKYRSARNALSHGLAIPAKNIAALQSDIESLALSIARASGENTITELSRQAAEAQVDILRIRKFARPYSRLKPATTNWKKSSRVWSDMSVVHSQGANAHFS
jgi:hypothetical protein